MMNLKRIEDGKYVLDLFKNLSRRKEIPIVIHGNHEQDYATMSFSPQKDDQLSIATENVKMELYIGLDLEIHFFYQEIYYSFSARITGLSGCKATIQYPATIFTSFKRLLNRYKIEPDVNACVALSSFNQRFRLRDINTKGLSLFAADELFQEGERIRNLLVEIGGEIEIRADAEVKHVSRHNNGQYVYGLVFIELEWTGYQKLFTYIFGKNYPDLKPLADFTMEELAGLYEESRYISLKPKDDEAQFFMDHIGRLEQLNYKPEIAANLVYLRNGKLLSVGSVFRMYDRTFFGQQLLLAPGARLNPRAKTDIYIGLADVMLNHPYCEYYLTYICSDAEWHQELFDKINARINDRDKFRVDRLASFECSASGDRVVETHFSHGTGPYYRIEALDEPSEFLAYTAGNLSFLENQCYHYQPEHLYLDEIRSTCQSFGFDTGRKIWRVFQAQTVIAYVVAEAYPDVMNPFDIMDTCRIYFIAGATDTESILQTILVEVSRFFARFQTKTFTLIANVLDSMGSIREISGLTPQNHLLRVMANREGLSEYKKLLMVEFEYYTKYYPLTYPQKGIWYTEKMYPGTSIGNISVTMRIKSSQIDYRALEAAINRVIEKNDGMRLRICEENNELKQYVDDYKRVKIKFHDFGENYDPNCLFQWDEKLSEVAFRLTDESLISFVIFKLNSNEGGVFIKSDHIVSDGWSMALTINQIMDCYHQLQSGIQDNLGKGPSYIDYIQNEEEYFNSIKFIKDKEFWSKKLMSFSEFTSLKPINNNYKNTKAKRKTFILRPSITALFNLFCEKEATSPYVTFLSILNIYIHRVTMKEEIIVGSPILNRTNNIEKNTIGIFVNTLPVKLNVDPVMEFKEFIQYVQREWMQILKHQRYPNEVLLREFRKQNKINKHIYYITLSYQNARLHTGKYSEEYKIRWLSNGYQTESLNIHIHDREGEGQYIVNMDYHVDLFTEDEIDGIFQCFLSILSDGISNPTKKLFQLELLPESEKVKVLYHFNNTVSSYPKDKTINQLFEEQVARTPGKVALRLNDQTITYQDLNKRSNQLARFLRKRGIKPDDIIGLMVERSMEMIIGILGILKAGGAYLPVDPEYPEERIINILSDSGAVLLLTQSAIRHQYRLDHGDINSKEIILFDNDMIWQELDENLMPIHNSSHLAYVMYTSGSTGKPKGTLTVHYNINRIVKNTNYITISENDRILQISNYAFDGSTFDIFGALLNGAELVLVTKAILLDIIKLSNVICEREITIFFITTALFNVLIDENAGCLLNVKKILFGGEKVSFQHVKKAFNLLGRDKLIHVYGPTESTVFASYYIVNEINEDLGTIPIGGPVSNTKIYIVDKNINPLPVGIPGELCISGDGIAKGYLNRSELTMEKFIPNPFNPNEKIYKSGDLAKWLTNGNIQFIDRLDNQIKLRGFRIELGEIEGQLIQFYKIKEVIVIDREGVNGKKYICAYFVSDEKLSDAELRDFLSKKLPGYMIPSYFIQVDEFPLTWNGKIDKKNLPEPNITANQNLNCAGPRNDTEMTLQKVFEEVLQIKHIGINDNFFTLGGDSLSILRVLSSVYNLDWNLTPQDFYNYPSIKKLSEKIVRGKEIISINKNDIVFRKRKKEPKKVFLSGEKVSFSYILLTGVTGFLGIHLLGEIIQTTQSKIFCLIRGRSNIEAREKLIQLLEFYFPNKKYRELMDERILIKCGDLRLEKFGLTDKEYIKLGTKTDIVIHAAALVKHFGIYEDFYENNVLGTKRIIDFSLHFQKKLNHISTLSVSGDNIVAQNSKNAKFSENDFYIGQNYTDNLYVMSKFQAENLVFKAIESGLKANIFRVGNLSERYSDGHFQININENMYHNVIKAIITVGVIPDQVLDKYFEFTPVDYCSKAIMQLISAKEVENEIFHLFNYKQIRIRYLFLELMRPLGYNFKILQNCSFKEFINYISKYQDNDSEIMYLVSNFNENVFSEKYKVRIEYAITEAFLQQIRFEWPDINLEYIIKSLDYMRNVGYLMPLSV